MQTTQKSITLSAPDCQIIPFQRRRPIGYRVTCPTCHRLHNKPWHSATQRGPRAELCTACFIGLKQ